MTRKMLTIEQQNVWGKTCQNFQKLNHFARVCRQEETEFANTLIARVSYHNQHHVYAVSSAHNTEEIPALVSTTIPHYKNTSPIEIHIFPDSGASIFPAGSTLVQKLNVKRTDLLPCYKKTKAVGGFSLTCHGMLPE